MKKGDYRTTGGLMKWTSSLVAIALVASAAWAAETPVAETSSSSYGISWMPLVENAGFTLAVSGNGKVAKYVFNAGQALSLEVADLEDGSYTWELRPVARTNRMRRRDQLGGSPGAAGAALSGSFRIQGGALVNDTLQERDAVGARTPRLVARDQVTPDDIIVQGSACVGFDCVNNEPFGFDTIRLKENNLRILFMDTSVGTFPTNDWQLVANDSASGGASRFSIEDVTGARTPFTIRAGAATNSLFVDSTGRMGLRTATPVLDLHINTSNTPAIRLEQNSSGGFTAQTWDIGANEANFFVRDVTGGSRLSFRVRPGAPTSSIDISSDGDVGIGTGSPDAPLEVERAASGLMMQLEGAGDVFFRQKNSTSGQFVDVNLIGDEFRLNFGTGGAGPELRLTNTGSLIITGTYTPDYVFEEGYELRTLDELRSFIEEHKHLPNVPSDAEVKQTRSIDVNKFQMTLLEKIEELTLYTLEQHETLKSLGDENAQLKTRLESLEQRSATAAQP